MFCNYKFTYFSGCRPWSKSTFIPSNSLKHLVLYHQLKILFQHGFSLTKLSVFNKLSKSFPSAIDLNINVFEIKRTFFIFPYITICKNGIMPLCRYLQRQEIVITIVSKSIYSCLFVCLSICLPAM